MKTLLAAAFSLLAICGFSAVPPYTAFKGTNGIVIRTNPPTGDVIIDGAGLVNPTNGVTGAQVTNIFNALNVTNQSASPILTNLANNSYTGYTNAPGFATNLMFAVNGDSLSTTNSFSDVGVNWTNTWQGYLYSIFPRWQQIQHTNFAVSGKTAYTVNSEYDTTINTVRPNVTNEYSGGVAMVWAGFNDIRSGSNAVNTFQALSNTWWRARMDNFLVVAFTIHQSTGISFQNAQEIERVALNNLMRTPANRWMYDYLADVETWTTNSAANKMLAIFDGDGVHFNTAGNRFIASNINSNILAASVAPIGMRGATIDGRLRVVVPDNNPLDAGVQVYSQNKTVNMDISYNTIRNSDDLFLFPGGQVGIGYDPTVFGPRTSLDVRGAIATRVVAPATLTSGNYTDDSTSIGVQDSIIGIPNGSARTNTLFDASAFQGREITVYDYGGTASGTNVYIITTSGQTINGGPTKTNITTDYGSLTLFSDGANFAIKVRPSTGSGSGVQTNADQFAPNVVLNIKDGASVTNINVNGTITQTGGGTGEKLSGALQFTSLGGAIIDANGDNRLAITKDADTTIYQTNGSGSVVVLTTIGNGGLQLVSSNGSGGMVLEAMHNLPVVITNILNFSNASPGQVLTVVSSNNHTVVWGFSNSVAATALSNLTDVSLVALQPGELLQWTGDGLWHNFLPFFQVFYNITVVSNVTINVGTNLEQSLAIATSNSFGLTYNGTPQPGERFNIVVFNTNPVVNINMTNNSFNPIVASNVLTYAIPSNSISSFTFVNRTNWNASGTNRWELDRIIAKQMELAAVGPFLALTTNSAGSIISISNTYAPQSSSTVISNLVNTVANNVTNVISLSTTNATSKPLTNSYTAGVLKLYGIEAGNNITLTPNGSNYVIASSAGGGTVSGSGTAYKIPKWTSSSAIGDSKLETDVGNTWLTYQPSQADGPIEHGFRYTSPSHINMTGEYHHVLFDFSGTVQFTNDIHLDSERTVFIKSTLYNASGGSGGIVTNGSTLYIDGPPRDGTFISVVNKSPLTLGSGLPRVIDLATNGILFRDAVGYVTNAVGVTLAGTGNNIGYLVENRLIATNSSVSNIVVSFSQTNTVEIWLTNNATFTNWTGIADDSQRNDKLIIIRPQLITRGVNWGNLGLSNPGFSVAIATNANNLLWTSLTNGKTYALSLTRIRTNIFPTLTLWE